MDRFNIMYYGNNINESKNMTCYILIQIGEALRDIEDCLSWVELEFYLCKWSKHGSNNRSIK